MPASSKLFNYTLKNRTACRQDVFATDLQQVCEQVVIIQAAVIPDQAATSLLSSTW